MAELIIRNENLAWRLLDIARREQRSVENVLESLLANYIPTNPAEPNQGEPEPGTLAMLGKSAEEAGIHSEKPVDTAGRSEEIAMLSEVAWIYYRIFLQHPNEFADFITLLNQVVRPVVEEFQTSISHIHFLYYSGAYKEHLEDGDVEARLANVQDDEYVGFVRLRLQVQAQHEQAIAARVLELASACNAVRGWEHPLEAYDPDKDLGKRFGSSRTQLVMNLLDATARLTLDYARGEPPIDPTNLYGGSRGIVHLVANTLRFNIILAPILFEHWGSSILRGGDRLL